MNLELHHIFILVGQEAKVADLLVASGMEEAKPNKHEGQGSANRRFFFANCGLELLYIHNEDEAINGPGSNLLLTERLKSDEASPFGIILSRKDNLNLGTPFNGWEYKPEYFDSWSFHVGENSSQLSEPLCIYMPFVEPGTLNKQFTQTPFNSISNVKIYTPNTVSGTLATINKADRINICNGKEHLMEITFDDNKCKQEKDLRPELPLIIYW